MLVIQNEVPDNKEILSLMDELSDCLEAITGSSGRGSFDLNDIYDQRSIFAVARENGIAIACGAIRPICEDIAEVKRMYARVKGKGTGSRVLLFLEENARNLGYKRIWLETRLINQKAVAFYESQGYIRIPNYGKYKGNNEAVCFEKVL